VAWAASRVDGCAEEPGPAARLAGGEAAESGGDLGLLGMEALRLAVMGHVALDPRGEITEEL
jgi:hypothetical protein